MDVLADNHIIATNGIVDSNAAVVSKRFADAYSLSKGDSFTVLYFESGYNLDDPSMTAAQQYTHQVGVVVDSLPFAPFADILLDWDNVIDPADNMMLYRGYIKSNDNNATEQALRALEDEYPEIEWGTKQDALREVQDQFFQRYLIFISMLVIVAVSLFTGVLSSTFSNMRQKNPEFAVLRAIGARPSEIRRYIYIQIASYLVFGFVIGTALGTASSILVTLSDQGAQINISFSVAGITMALLSAALVVLSLPKVIHTTNQSILALFNSD